MVKKDKKPPTAKQQAYWDKLKSDLAAKQEAARLEEEGDPGGELERSMAEERPPNLDEPPVYQVPHVDPEVAAMMEVEARKAPPRRPRPKREVSAEEVGSAMAMKLLAEEAKARKAASDRRRGVPAAPGAEIPIVVAQRKVRDRTATGKEFVNKGWVSRWVRQVDSRERPSAMRVEEFEDFGYEPVLDKAGKPVESIYGVLMQAPPRQYAARVAAFSPEGINNPNAEADAARAIVESANSVSGRQIARLVGDGAQEDNFVGVGDARLSGV